MIRIALLPLLAIGVAIADLGTIQRISTLTSICNDCDMTLFGTINVKVCGGGGGVGVMSLAAAWSTLQTSTAAFFSKASLTTSLAKHSRLATTTASLNNPSDLDVTV